MREIKKERQGRERRKEGGKKGRKKRGMEEEERKKGKRLTSPTGSDYQGHSLGSFYENPDPDLINRDNLHFRCQIRTALGNK